MFFPSPGAPLPLMGKTENSRPFSRIRQIHLQEDSRGSINYKDLNLFQNIEAGDVICDIIPPGDGTDGTDVLGHAVPAKKGNAPVIPQGKNTVLNERKNGSHGKGKRRDFLSKTTSSVWHPG